MADELPTEFPRIDILNRDSVDLVRRPIFVISCGRSGSRLVVDILELFSILVLETSFRDHTGKVREHTKLNQLHRFIEPWRNRLDFSWAVLETYQDECQTVISWLDSTIDCSTKGPGGFGPVIKDPRLLHLLPAYFDAYPQGRFIHVIRDGRDYAISKREELAYWGKNPVSIDQLLKIWDFRLSIVEPFRGDPRFHELRFEDILDEAEREIGRLSEFLDLPIPAALPKINAAKARRHSKFKEPIPIPTGIVNLTKYRYLDSQTPGAFP